MDTLTVFGDLFLPSNVGLIIFMDCVLIRCRCSTFNNILGPFTGKWDPFHINNVKL